MRHIRLALLLIAVAGLAEADSSIPSRSPKVPKGARKRPVGYIVPEARGGGFYTGQPQVTFWTPKQEDVDRLEDRMPHAFRTSPRARGARHAIEYGRQYVGIVAADGNKKIWVNLFCGEEEIREPWQTFTVFDGGDCNCRVTYDIVTGLFTDIECNGIG